MMNVKWKNEEKVIMQANSLLATRRKGAALRGCSVRNRMLVERNNRFFPNSTTPYGVECGGGNALFYQYLNPDGFGARFCNVAEYAYNANGAMTKDLNKGISDIQYNSLNLPRLIDIKSPVAEARNEYTYSASGQKLKVVQKWNPNFSTAPAIGSAINTATLTESKTTDYIGDMIYENGALKRILIDGGYVEGGVYHYYLTDHLGNNRLVVNASGTVVQKNHYYPFGTAFAETPVAEQGKQPYKFGSKELDQMSGLNWYDFLARYKDDFWFPTIDPHCEKYYRLSPYCAFANNPVRNVDPTGKDWILLSSNEQMFDLDPAQRVKDDNMTKGNLDIAAADNNNKDKKKDGSSISIDPETKKASVDGIFSIGVGLEGLGEVVKGFFVAAGAEISVAVVTGVGMLASLILLTSDTEQNKIGGIVPKLLRNRKRL